MNFCKYLFVIRYLVLYICLKSFHVHAFPVIIKPNLSLNLHILNIFYVDLQLVLIPWVIRGANLFNKQRTNLKTKDYLTHLFGNFINYLYRKNFTKKHSNNKQSNV